MLKNNFKIGDMVSVLPNCSIYKSLKKKGARPVGKIIRINTADKYPYIVKMYLSNYIESFNDEELILEKNINKRDLLNNSYNK